jgi:hypothetical protein
MIHSLALVTKHEEWVDVEKQDMDQVVQNYLNDCGSMTDQIEFWDTRYKDFLFTYEQAKLHGYDYFDEAIDKICFIKGFSSVVF